MMHLENPLRATKPGDPLRAALVGSVSTEHQDKHNIQASFRTPEKFMRENTDGPVVFTKLGEQASGMLADHESINRVEETKETEKGAVDPQIWQIVMGHGLTAKIALGTTERYSHPFDATIRRQDEDALQIHAAALVLGVELGEGVSP